MSMTVIKITTHWEAGEAYSVIEFLDQLRDVLWQHYSEEVTQMLCEDSSHVDHECQHDLPFDDPLDF